MNLTQMYEANDFILLLYYRHYNSLLLHVPMQALFTHSLRLSYYLIQINFDTS